MAFAGSAPALPDLAGRLGALPQLAGALVSAAESIDRRLEPLAGGRSQGR